MRRINLPELDVLKKLIAAYKPGGRLPALTADEMPAARSLLSRLVSDHEALREYLDEVRDPLSQVDPAPDIEYEVQCCCIIDHGVEAVSPNMLARVLLDPVGVVNIHMAVESEAPACWLPALTANGRELLRKNGLPTDIGPLLQEGGVSHLQVS